MPTMTQLVRDGQPVPLKWAWADIYALRVAMAQELGKPEAEVRMFPGGGSYTYTAHHYFYDFASGEATPILHIMPGDVYRAWYQPR